MTEKVSIILTTCCRNEHRLNLLNLSMNSLVLHTRCTKELIISDNGDKRQTEYLKRLNPYKHLVFGENKGVIYGRNAGATEARGEYLCFIDGDLVYRRDWARTMVNLLKRFPKRKLIATGIHGEIMRANTWRCREHNFSYQIWSRSCGGCLLMSRKAWEEVGPWPDVWRFGFEFCSQANKAGYSFIVPVPAVSHTIDDKPSYDKRLLAESYSKGEPQWKMVC